MLIITWHAVGTHEAFMVLENLTHLALHLAANAGTFNEIHDVEGDRVLEQEKVQGAFISWAPFPAPIAHRESCSLHLLV